MFKTIPSKVQTISLILCMGLVIASICIPLSVYESLENQVNRWLQETGADDFSLGLFSPKLMEQLRKTQVSEIGIFAAKGEIFFEDSAEENSAMLYNFTSARMAGIQSLPHVDEIYWWRNYSCDFYVSGDDDGQFLLLLVSPGYFELSGLQVAQGRLPTEADPATVAVLGSGAAQKLFGSAESAIGQTLATSQMTSPDCQRSLTVIGVLTPFSEPNNPDAKLVDSGIFIPDREPLDEIVFLPDGRPYIVPVFFLWVSPKPGYQREAISEVRNYFKEESGDRIYLQVTTRGDYYRVLGGIQARLAYLPYIGNIVGLVTLVAAVNLGLILSARLRKKQYEIGVKRSLGASRRQILGEQLGENLLVWAVAISIGIMLSFALTPAAGAYFQARQNSAVEAFPAFLGTWSSLFTIIAGFLLGILVTIVSVHIFLKRSVTALLSGHSASLGGGFRGTLSGGAGFAIGTLALVVLFGLRDGAIAHFDKVLGWAGGEASGAIVDWNISTDSGASTRIAELSSMDYEFLREQFPDAQFGWLGRKGNLSGVEVIEASASIETIRLPQMLAGRWFNLNEEKQQTLVTVLGLDLARQLAEQKGISPENLVGTTWRSYRVIGVMDEWPMRHGLGFYSDAAYVPIGASREQITFPGGQIPFIAPNGVQVHEFVRLMQQSLAPSHPEGTPQFILAAEEVGELLEWRLRLYLLLSAFAVVSLLVGGFGIMNVLFVWVVNRWREIGVRRAVGASRADVARMVLGQGLQITLFAALAGGTAGTLLALVIQYASGWPLTLYLSWLAIACGVAIVAALVFGGLPAWWAASRAPTEMLRME